MREAATNKLKTSSLPDLTSASKLLYLREEKEKKTLPLHTHTHTHTHAGPVPVVVPWQSLAQYGLN